MALTITATSALPLDVWGQTEVRFVNAVPAAADYATGGYSLTAGTGISLGTIYYVIPLSGQGGYVLQWSTATNKLLVYQQSAATSALTQVPAATDLSALTFVLMILGN